MFVKFVSHWHDWFLNDKGISDRDGNTSECFVYPKTSEVYDNVKNITYRKVRVADVQEYDKILKKLDNYEVIFGIPKKYGKDGFELIWVLMYMNDPIPYKEIIAINCSMYLMSNSGKTVDSIHCFSA